MSAITHDKRAVTLPCDLNATLYVLHRDCKNVTEYEIDYFITYPAGVTVVFATMKGTQDHKDPYQTVFYTKDFGKSVFTSIKKAEEAIKPLLEATT